jgi:hypothetical protein
MVWALQDGVKQNNAANALHDSVKDRTPEEALRIHTRRVTQLRKAVDDELEQVNHLLKIMLTKAAENSKKA